MNIFDMVISLIRELVLEHGLQERLGENLEVFYLVDGCCSTKRCMVEFGSSCLFVLCDKNDDNLIEVKLVKDGYLEYNINNGRETINGYKYLNEIDKNFGKFNEKKEIDWMFKDLSKLDKGLADISIGTLYI